MPGDSKKTWQFFVSGFKGKKLSFTIGKNESIQTLIDMIAKEVGLKPKEIIVIYAGKQFDTNKAKEQHFEDYDLHNLSELVLVTRVHGGHRIKPEGRTRDASPIRYSPEPCIISDEDSDDCRRVRMPCGHPIVPDELKEFCRQKLKKGEYQFYCPIKTCKKEWKYSTIRRYASLTDAEMAEFEDKISLNYIKRCLGEIVACPGCKSFCLRDDDAKRVECPHCTADKGKRYFFCWQCLGPWKTGSREDYCGNEGCDPGDPRLDILHDHVKLVKVQSYYGKFCETPSIRACINCGTLNHYVGGCKHITCKAKGCNSHFCLICLRPYGARLPGGCSYGVECELAPIQTSIPTKRL